MDLRHLGPSRVSAMIGSVRHRNDPSVQADLNWGSHEVGLPVGLEIQWLGTAGFRLAYEGTTIVIDPYLSRVSLGDLARNRVLQSDAAMVDRVLPNADAVLVGHSHFDHAVDVPHLAAAHGCPVYGSESVRHLLGLFGLAEQAVVVEPRRRYEIGPFTISFTPSLHSKLLLGRKVPMDGELTCGSLKHLGGREYRCGQVWAFTIEVAGITMYHEGSAGRVADALSTMGGDVLLCGIAGRLWSPNFTRRIIAAVDPGLIVAHHHDDFFRPVDAEMGYSFNVNLGGFVEEVAAVDPNLPVQVLEPLQTVRGGGAGAVAS